MQSYRHPGAQWLGSPNFTPDRDGHDMAIQPAYVVLHTMVGTVESANQRFQDPGQQASAHYGVRLRGDLVQWVDEKDAAWADSTLVDNPGANLDSVSIEHEDGGDYNGPRTPELYAASVALVKDICQRYGIPIDRQHVLKHLECAHAATSCPDALDVERIVREAAGAPPSPPDQQVVPAQPVSAVVFRASPWLDYESLQPVVLDGVAQVASARTGVTWTEAKRVDGVWYDRIERPDGSPGAWALNDADVDDTQPGDGAPSEGWDPTHFAPPPPAPSPPPPSPPAPAPPPAPPPTPPPAPAPPAPDAGLLQQVLTALEELVALLRKALGGN